jgi:hypothetical protein
MSPTVEQLVARAWSAMWREGSPYYLPAAFRSGRLSGHVRVRPLPALALPSVSNVVLMDRAPWGGVTLSLANSELTGLNSAAGVDYTYDDASGQITMRIRFSGLRCTGGYVVRTGHQTGSAVAAALVALNAKPLGASVGATSSTSSNTSSDNIALAKTYQTQLIGMQSDNGRIMVASYYQNNDTYSELFQLPSFVQVWSSHTTAGQTTQYYANQTSNAAQPQNAGTVPVNGQPDQQGYSPYNSHSFFMQNYVMATCYAAAQHYGTSTELGQRYQLAGDDATDFGTTAQPQSQSAMTVNGVLNTVNTAPPPTGAANRAPGAPRMLLVAPANEPQWLKEVRAKAQAMAKDNFQKDVVDGGIDTAARARPQQGTYNGPVPEVVLTVTGRVDPTGGPGGVPCVTFATADVQTVDVNIALEGMAGELGTELTGALGRAQFLSRLMGYRSTSALTSEPLLTYLSRQMCLALAQRLGATG